MCCEFGCKLVLNYHSVKKHGISVFLLITTIIKQALKKATMPSSCQSFLSPCSIPYFLAVWHSPLTDNLASVLALWQEYLPGPMLCSLFPFFPLTLFPDKLTWDTEMKRLHCVTEKKNVSNQDVPVAGTFSPIFSYCKNLWHLYVRTHTPCPCFTVLFAIMTA